MKKITREARDKKKGMDIAELLEVIGMAKREGCALTKTRVGFGGQIIEMRFEGKEDERG